MKLTDDKGLQQFLILCENCIFSEDEGKTCTKWTYPHPTEPGGFCDRGAQDIDGVLYSTGEYFI